MTILKQLGSHMSHTTNTPTVLHFVFIGTTPSVAFVIASDFVGDAKRLHLPCFDGF